MKKRMLFITHEIPFPPASGGTIKTWKLLEYFAQTHELSLVCLKKGQTSEGEADMLDKLRPARYFSKAVDIPRNASSYLQSILKRTPLPIYRNYDKEVAEVVNEYAMDCDILFVDHYEMFCYVPEVPPCKVVLHTHNAEFLLWKRHSIEETSWPKKLVTRWEAGRVLRKEKEYIRRSDLVLASENDRDVLKREGLDTSHFTGTYHLGNDEMLSWPEMDFSHTPKQVLFVGSLWWEPNIDGLLWFLSHVWAQVVQKDPGIHLVIAGKQRDNRIEKASKSIPNVEIAGFVEDLGPLYAHSRIAIAPLRYGSGMKVKVLNYLYRGIPVVASPVALEGIPVQAGKDLLVAESPEQWIETILRLAGDIQLCSQIGKTGRQTAALKLTWMAHLKEIGDAIDALLDQ
ncbi:MAG: glycosyltransferase [Flavobacteriales bacterium]|nr:glycosyltransferase [Flavobacteriales bacterium]MCB9447424.1 glycosyltransferase [Flavobacteriales bacterium]